VCDGNGNCDGDYFHYTCDCFDNYQNPNKNLQHCKPDDCTTNLDVCGGHGICSGTFFVFGCKCYPGFQQFTYPNGQSTCQKASCTNEQCGGTSTYPYGSCGDGFYDNYNCTCKDKYAHPMLPDNTPVFTKCDVACDKTHCGKQGVKECVGTTTEYYCVCEDEFMYENDDFGHPIMTYCKAKCDNNQCGTVNGTALGKCSGSKSKYTCECKHGYSNPLNRALKPMRDACEVSCSDMQCGMSYEVIIEEEKNEKNYLQETQGQVYEKWDRRYKEPTSNNNNKNSIKDGKDEHEGKGGMERLKPREISHGKCMGARVSYTCKCKPGFEHAKDRSRDIVTTICIDINECEKDVCDKNAKCINTPGSYRCVCKDKYVGMGTKEQGCYLNGGWGEWKHEQCSKSCGGGMTSKYRECLVRGVGHNNGTGNRTSYNAMQGVCEGDAAVHNIHCNLFDCDNLCMKTKCKCGMVKQFTKGNEPQLDLKYFDYIERFDFNAMSGIVAKISEMSKKDLCKDNQPAFENDIKKILNREMENVKEMLRRLKRAKTEMRNYINCNENPEVRETMFATYKELATNSFMTSFIENDLLVEAKIINKKLSMCRSDKHVMFGDLMDLLNGSNLNL